MLKAGLKVLALLLPVAAYAELNYMMLPFNLTCGPTGEVFEHGYNTYGEKPSFKATADNGRMLIWSLNDDASAMSLVVSDPDGTSCVVWSTYCNLGECLEPFYLGDTR